MNAFAAGFSNHPNSATATGEAVASVADHLARRDLVVVGIGGAHEAEAEEIERAVRSLLSPGVAITFTTGSVLGGGVEAEGLPAISIFAASFEHALATVFAIDTIETPEGAAMVGMVDEFASATAALLFADPFTTPAEAVARQIGLEYPQIALVGGLMTTHTHPGPAWLSINGDVHDRGAVGVAFEGIDMTAVVSQGCRPVGEPFVITNGEANLITELGGKPALTRLMELVELVAPDERELLASGLHIGLVIDEHQSEFHRGDFLVRAVLGADHDRGGIAIGDRVEIGQTVQFQVRDAESADEDLRTALTHVDHASAALLFTCNGRGQSLFERPNHDTETIQELLGPIPLGGAFCAGEFGPVGGKNFVHGFTASMAIFHG